MKQTVYLDQSTGQLMRLSQQTLEHRAGLVRAVMERQNVDLLLIVSPAQEGDRYWLTGANPPERLSEGGVFVPKEGPVVSVHGGRLAPPGENLEKDWSRGIGGGDALYSCVMDQDGFDIGLIRQLLQGGRRLGIVHPEALRLDLRTYLVTNLPQLELSDCTEPYERCKLEKSPEEIDLLRRAAAMLDKVMGAATAEIRPMMLERDVVNNLRHAAYLTGCGGPDNEVSSPVRLTSNRDGAPVEQEPLLYPGRMISEGDRVNVQMYAVGDSNVYGGISRSFVTGTVQESTKRLWETALQAQTLAAGLLKPGVTLAQVRGKVNDFLVQQGCLADDSNFLHGIFHTPGQRPRLYDPSMDWPLPDHSVLMIEPAACDGVTDPVRCGDMFLITASGAQRLSRFPQELIEL